MTIQGAARRGLLWVLVLLLAAPPGALAQTAPPYPPPYPPSYGPPPPGAPAPPTFRQEELDQLLAPIALYPDALVAQILMASTYPLEVVQASRWVQANPNIRGPQLEAMIPQLPWDPSVKSLLAFPQVLAMMDQRLDWTQRLGDAFLGQQQEVMATIQMLRAKAYAAGYLQNTPQQTVVYEPPLIQIVPVSPQVVYVPIYNPLVVYGPWWYPAYRPFYWYPRGYVVGPTVFAFGAGIVVGPLLWGGFDWHRRHVTIINVHNYNTINRTTIATPTWRHEPVHRMGVPYHDPGVQQRFGQGPRPGVTAREPFRGRAPEPAQAPSQGSVDRRPGARPGAPVAGVPPAAPSVQQPPLAAPRQPERERPGARPSGPVAGVPPAAPAAPAQPSGVAPRQPEAQRPGARPGAPVAGVPPAAPSVQQPPPAAPRQPGALEGVGHGGQTRNFSDRGRMSRQSAGVAGPAPSTPTPPTRGPEVKGPAKAGPGAPATKGGDRPNGRGGEPRN